MARDVFFCQDCTKEFNQTLYVGDLEKGSAACPHCGSKRVSQQAAAFAAAAPKKNTSRISPNHPLRRLFAELVGKELTWDREVAAYVSDLLIDFVHVDNLYWIRNYRGKGLEEVGEMLVESNPLLDAPSFEREREVRKHIGDYTLFLTGLFPEHVAALPRRGLRLDSFIDYMKAGKESYQIVAAFNQFEYRQVAPLFRRLAEQFEYCVHGLNRVKRDLEVLREEQYQLWKKNLLDT
jgi:DNA-directed RNA polymerase subunit RPC12/RpoP